MHQKINTEADRRGRAPRSLPDKDTDSLVLRKGSSVRPGRVWSRCGDHPPPFCEQQLVPLARAKSFINILTLIVMAFFCHSVVLCRLEDLQRKR